MICSRGWLGVLPVLAVIGGCSRPASEVERTPPTAPPKMSSEPAQGWRLEVAPPPRELIYLEVTPAAAREITVHVKEMGLERWWLLYRVTPEGCTGIFHHLDLETALPDAGDVEVISNGVPCLVRKSQAHLAQGTRIDVGEKDGKRGFIVTAPHATQRTKDAVAKWISDEFNKRNPDLDRPADTK